MQRIAILAATGLLGGWSPLVAQSSPQSAPPTYGTTLVVTATLEPEPPEQLSATTDRIDAEEIALRRSASVIELLRTVPGLAVAQSGSPGKVASLFVRGASSAQTLVLFDGVPLNDPVLGGFDWSAPVTEGLERIEVVRGPYSALWGSQAVGGVVQLLPRSSPERFGALRLEGGSDAARRVSLSAALPLGAASFDLAGSLWRGEGELRNDFFDGDQLRLRADLHVGDGWRVGALVRSAAATIGLPFDFFGAPSPAREQRSESRLAALPIDGGGRDWRWQARLSRHQSELQLRDPGDLFAASDSETRRDHGRIVARRRLGELGWVAAGFERERQAATTSSAFGAGLADAHQSHDAWFAQMAVGRGPLRVDVGARRDRHSRFGGATTMKAGAVWTIADGARLRAGWGESFRAPSLGDLFFPFFGNPELEPERGESAELGFEFEVGLARSRFAGGVVAFANDYDDLIQFDVARGLPFNIGSARARGLEVSGELRRERLRVRWNATWLDTEDRATGEPLPRRPEWSGNLIVSWVAAEWDATATLRQVGERIDVGGVGLAPYGVVDLAFGWSGDPRWQPYLRVENLLDRSWQEVFGYPAAGRRWALGVALRSRR